MRTVLTAIAAATAAIGLSWPSGAVQPAWATAVSLPHPPARLAPHLACQVPDLPLKDLSRLPEIECRWTDLSGRASAARPAGPGAGRPSA